MQIAKHLLQAIGRNHAHGGGAANVGGEHFRKAGAEPVHRGVAGGVVERHNRQRNRRRACHRRRRRPTAGARKIPDRQRNPRHQCDQQNAPAYDQQPAPAHARRGHFRFEVQTGRGGLAAPYLKVVQHFASALIAQVHIHGQALVDYAAQHQRNRRVHFRAWLCRLARPLQQAGNRALGFERHSPGEQLVADEAEGENIRPLVQLLAQRLFRRHVFHGADQRAGLRHSVAFDGARQAEVHDDNAAVLLHHHVLRLQVAVQDAFVVRRFQRKANLLQNARCFIGRELPPLLQNGAQITPGHQLHGHEAHARVFGEVVHPHHVTVRYLVREPQFLLEAIDDRRVPRQFRPDHFERDHPVELAILRPVHRSHAAGAQHGEDLIAAGQHRAGFQLCCIAVPSARTARTRAAPGSAGATARYHRRRIGARARHPWGCVALRGRDELLVRVGLLRRRHHRLQRAQVIRRTTHRRRRTNLRRHFTRGSLRTLCHDDAFPGSSTTCGPHSRFRGWAGEAPGALAPE